MRPIHWAVVGAVAAVAVLFLFFANDDGGTRATRVQRGTRDPAPRDLDRRPESGDELPAGATLSVQVAVALPNDTPAAGATIQLTGPRTATVSADREGRARIDDLPPGPYNLLARSGNAAGARSFRLDRDLDLGVLTLAAAVRVRGHVYDIAKRPLAGAVVEGVVSRPSTGINWLAFSAGLSTPDVLAGRTATAADGSYELLLPGQGNYALRAWAAAHAVEVEATREVAGLAEGVDFYLLPGRTVTGVVVDEDSTPIAGALVIAAAIDYRLLDLQQKVQTATAADGTFAIPVPSANRIHFAVSATGYARYVDPRLDPSGRELRIVLHRGVTVRLRAVAKDTGKPAAGITAKIAHRGGIAEGVTDGHGYVALPHLPDPNGPNRGGWLNLMLAGGPYVPQRVSLRSLEPVGGVADLGEIELETGGTVRGRVRDKVTGAAIANALVRPFGGRSVQIALMAGIGATTDAEGRYELQGVPRDTALMVGTHQDYVTDVRQADLFQHMRGGGKALFADGVNEIEFDIELVPAHAIRGVVVAPDGSPVGGARVQPPYPTRGGLSRMLGGGDQAAVSDGNGRFVLGGFKQGEKVQLVAEHREFGSAAPVSTEVGSGDAVTLQLEPPLLLKGRVVNEANAPVVGVRVSAAPKTNMGEGRPPLPGAGAATRPGITDEAGQYVVRNAPYGELTISFDHKDYVVLRRNVAVSASGEEMDLGTTKLSRGPGLEGIVVDRAGQPRSGLQVSAGYVDRPPGPGPSSGRTWGSAVTDAGGRFVIHGLLDGKYRVAVASAEYFGDRPVVRTGARDVRIVVREAATLTGIVQAAGAPVSGAWIRADLAENTEEETSANWTAHIANARSGNDGTFRLDRLPPDAAFNVTVTHNQYRANTFRDVTVAQSGRVFTLDAGGRIAGTVVDDAGQAVAQASLRVWVAGRSAKWARADAQGRFEFSGLNDGAVEIQMLSSPEGHVRSARKPVTAGDLAVQVVVARGATIEGTLVGDDRGGRSFSIEALDASGNAIASAWATAGRAFVLKGLAKGAYAIRVTRIERGGGRAVVAELARISTGTADLEIAVGD